MSALREREERTLLEALMVYPERLEDAQRIVSQRDFTNPANAAIYQGMLDAAKPGEQLTLDAVVNALGRNGRLQIAGGPAAVNELVDSEIGSKPEHVRPGFVVDCALALADFEPFEHMERHDRLPLPIDAMPAWIRDYVTGLSTALQVPVDMIAALVLGALSTARAGRTETEVSPGYLEPSQLWLFSIAPPADRKSASINRVFSPVYAAESEAADELRVEAARSHAVLKAHEEAHKKAGSALATKLYRGTDEEKLEAQSDLEDAVRECEMAREQLVQSDRLMTSDATPEVLAELMVNNSQRIALVTAEGAEVIDQALGRYGDKPNYDIYLKAHAGDTHTVDRMGRESIQLGRPALTIAATIQPAVFEKLRKAPSAEERGLLGRCVFIWPDSLVGRRDADPQPLIETVREAYTSKLRAMVEDQAERTLKLTSEAHAAFVRLAEEIEPELGAEDGRFVDLAAWGGKLTGLTVRLAALIHEADHAAVAVPEAIEAETFERARELSDWAASHALYSFAEMRQGKGTAAALKCWRWIARQAGKESGPFVFERRRLHQSVHGGRIRGREDLNAAIEVLVQRGYLRRLPDGRYFAANPEALQRHQISA